jgi:Protein of unknown function (DUF4240)
MADERFWQLIDEARDGSPTTAQPKKLKKILSRLSSDEIIAFGHVFYERLCDLNHWRLWAAGYIIAGDMSGDSFHYFRSWIIGKGKEVFDVAMRNPDGLGRYVDDREVDNELLEYVAIKVLQDRGVTDDPRDLSKRSADDAPGGEPFDEETVGHLCPMLAARFG